MKVEIKEHKRLKLRVYRVYVNGVFIDEYLDFDTAASEALHYQKAEK